MKINLNKVLNNMNKEYKILKSEISTISRSNNRILKKVELLELNRLAKTHKITEKINENEVKIADKLSRLEKIEKCILIMKIEAIKYIDKIEKYSYKDILEELNFDSKKMLWEHLFKEIIWNSDDKKVSIKIK